MQPIYEQTNCAIKSVVQTHTGNLEVTKTYFMDTVEISKREIYSAIEGRVELVSVEDC